MEHMGHNGAIPGGRCNIIWHSWSKDDPQGLGVIDRGKMSQWGIMTGAVWADGAICYAEDERGNV